MDRAANVNVVLTAVLCVGIVTAFAVWIRSRRRRRSEGAAELRWRRIIETLPPLVWTATADGLADYFSPQSSAFTGRSQDALLGWGWLEAIHRDDRASSQEAWSRAVAEGHEYKAELRLRQFDGEYRWLYCHGRPVHDATGRIVQWVGVSIDVTDRKLAEARAQGAKRHVDLMMRLSHSSLWEISIPDGNVSRGQMVYDDCVSARGLEANPLGDVDFPAMLSRLAVVPEDREPFMRAIQKGVDGDASEIQVEFRSFAADGSARWRVARGAISRDPSGKATAITGVDMDITNLKRAEEERRAITERLELAILGSKAHTWDHELVDGTMAGAKSTFTNMWESLGYDPSDPHLASGNTVPLHPEDADAFATAVHAFLAGPEREWEREVRVRHKDGSERWHLARGLVERDPVSGTALRYTGCSVDITDLKLVEERLRESEQRWRTLAEMLPQFVFTTGPDGLADYVSARMTEYTGRPLTELLGLSWQNVIHPDDLGYTSKVWKESVEQQRSREVEHRIRRWDGQYRWFTTRAEAVRDSAGRIFKWFGTSTDVTNLKEREAELRHAKERPEVAIRSSNLSVWEYDMPDGILEHAQQTFTNVWESLGYDPAGAPPAIGAVIHPDDLGRVVDEIRAHLSGETTEFETEHRVKHNDGSYRWLLGRGVALRDPGSKAIRFVGTSVDITEIKGIETDLQRARDAAETANRAKDEFLANVSHEIRTPMNAILGMTELALDSARTEHQRQLLSTVKSAAKNLLGIINDLLDFSKIAAGKLALDEADFWLRAEVGDTLRALAARAHRKGLELICHVDPDVPDALFGDAGRVRQVLMNLVGNALKFTVQGEVVVDVAVAGDRSSARAEEMVSLIFTIRDTGIGIARDKRAAIFRAFEQEDSSTTRRYGGTGLGLTISAQLAALMDGTIAVESEAGRGSTFTFTARFARSSRSEQPVPSPELLEGLRVLVVDDNETNRGILGEWLTSWRMRPTTVGDARSAFEALVSGEELGTPYSLVLLDGRMPDVDGITLAGQILERYGTSKRLILLSSDDSPILATRSREAGIRAYLLKPARQSELLDTIWLVMNATIGETPDGVPSKGGPSDLASGIRSPSFRILVAEDNELNAALLKTLLTKRGHRAQFAENGRLALERAMESTVDLVLLDLHMPEVDGFEVVRAIRERERTTGKHLPIVALTARSSNRDRDRCLAAGMDDFLPKPIEAEALWAAVARMMAAFPPAAVRESRLLDPRAILRACAGESDIFDGLCNVFRHALPEHLARVGSALLDHDLPRLGDAAHKLFGTLGAFSTVAGAVALTVEDAAKRQDFESCAGLVGQLESMCSELLEDTRGLTMADLSL